MKKLDFMGGLLCGALLTASMPVISTAAQQVYAVLSPQSIYLDGEKVDWTVYNVNDQNYIRLADLCPELGVGLWWDAENNAVGMSTDGTVPEITAAETTTAPSLTYYTVTPGSNTIPMATPDFSGVCGVEGAQKVVSQMEYWVNTAIYGMYGGYLGLNTENYISEVLEAYVIDQDGEKLFYEKEQGLKNSSVSPIYRNSEVESGIFTDLKLLYVFQTKDGSKLRVTVNSAVILSEVGKLKEIFITSVSATMDEAAGYVFEGSSYDGFGVLVKRPVGYTDNGDWSFPAYNFFIGEMIDDFIHMEWDENGKFVGWHYY